MKNYSLKFSFILLASIFFHPSTYCQKPNWIYYPGDFSIWLHQEVSIRRQERNEIYPPFWRIDTYNPVVSFKKKYSIAKEEQAILLCDGLCLLFIDGRIKSDFNKKDFTIPAGEHVIQIKVVNNNHVPSIWFKSKSLFSNDTWLVTNQDKSWRPVAYQNFTNPQFPPSSYKLMTEKNNAIIIEKTTGGLLVDFGKETFGFTVFEACLGNGKVGLFYGESREEAMSGKLAETYEYLSINSTKPEDYTIPVSRAFRYINIQIPESLIVGNVSMLY